MKKNKIILRVVEERKTFLQTEPIRHALRRRGDKTRLDIVYSSSCWANNTVASSTLRKFSTEFQGLDPALDKVSEEGQHCCDVLCW